ncbi:MAG: hypothetical protein ACYDAE_28110 [Steroidobacteraceae bacterium]
MINLHDLEGLIDNECAGRGAYLLPRVLRPETPARNRLRIQRANPPQHGPAGNRFEVLRRTAPNHLLVNIFGFDARLLEIVVINGQLQNAFTLRIELNRTTAPATALVE